VNSLVSDELKTPQLHVEIIDTYDGLLNLQVGWQELEVRDPEMTFFLSWEWLAEAFHQHPGKWRVLVVRQANEENRCVGILPLKYRLHWSRTRNQFETQIEAGGRLMFSEYTGFLCEAGLERPVMEAFGDALRQMPWAKLSLRYLAQKQRAELFCATFDKAGYVVSWKDYRINKGQTDNLICPKVSFPDRFDTYLSSISANTRQQYRRFERRHLLNGECHFTYTDATSLDRDMTLLMKFWRQKWEPLKGLSVAKSVAGNFENVLRSAFSLNALFLPILWRGETPLGALGHVTDAKQGAMHFIIAGRDTSAKDAFIGKALHFHSIEHAITRKYKYYDFGHGDEPYKFTYGANRLKLQYFSISRAAGKDDRVFDPINSYAALERVEKFIEEGKMNRARAAYRQLAGILEQYP
jgi:CelD/BcsL family acetyltransferase involved in cellulose biosynthesis